MSMSEPGVFTWTSPLGYTYRRDHTGSRATGRAWPEAGTTNPPGPAGANLDEAEHDQWRAPARRSDHSPPPPAGGPARTS